MNHRSYLDRLLSASLVLLASAIALSWAWRMLRPLLPVAVGIGVICALIAIVRWRRSYW